MESKLIRQGDVLFIPITADAAIQTLGKEFEERKVADGVIARGAHTHRVDSESLKRDAARVYNTSTRANGWQMSPGILSVRSKATIVHEEHASITFFPDVNANGGTFPAYFVIQRAREFDPMSEVPRMVVD